MTNDYKDDKAQSILDALQKKMSHLGVNVDDQAARALSHTARLLSRSYKSVTPDLICKAFDKLLLGELGKVETRPPKDELSGWIMRVIQAYRSNYYSSTTQSGVDSPYIWLHLAEVVYSYYHSGKLHTLYPATVLTHYLKIANICSARLVDNDDMCQMLDRVPQSWRQRLYDYCQRGGMATMGTIADAPLVTSIDHQSTTYTPQWLWQTKIRDAASRVFSGSHHGLALMDSLTLICEYVTKSGYSEAAPEEADHLAAIRASLTSEGRQMEHRYRQRLTDLLEGIPHNKRQAFIAVCDAGGPDNFCPFN